MAMGDGGPAALPAGRPAAQAGHLGVGAGLIDEDQLLRIEVRLGVEPGLTRPPYVRAVLLAGVRRLFFSVMSCRWQNRQTTLTAGR